MPRQYSIGWYFQGVTPINNDIYKTLNLLVMLSRSRKQLFPKLSDEEKAQLIISKQILRDSGLTVPEFNGALSLLGAKGYTWHLVFFDDHLRSQINQFINSSEYVGTIEKFKVLDTREFSDKIKASVSQDFEKILPPGIELDQEEIRSDNVVFTKAFDEGIQIYKKMRSDEIALVILWPFRNIEKLLKRMQSGESFDEIQDSDIWYDWKKYEFHIGKDVISTSYQGKPNVEHYVLEKLENSLDDGVIGYEDIDGHKPESLKSNLQKFIKKHERLKEIFKIRKDRLEFDRQAFN